MLVDSHCHLDRLDLAPYDGSLDALLDATRDAGVGHLLCVAIDLDAYPAMVALVEGRAEISISVGVHPNDREGPEPSEETLIERADHPQNVAIGETGLDYFRSDGDLEWQRERFRTHIRAARRIGKPLIIHTRDARDDTLAIMRDEGADRCGGVMHCFTEDWAMAEAALDLGFYISLSGIVTFRTADALRDVARRVPLERLLIETDAPYLAPVPHRGKSNQPRFVRHVAECIAEVRGMPIEAIAEATTGNFMRLFRPQI